MKISTLFLGGALLMSTSAMAQDNLLAKANEGALGDKGAMAQNGWQCWKFPFTYDQIDEEFTFSEATQIEWDSNGPGGNGVRWENKSSAVTYNGASYSKPVAFIRWDNGSMHSFWFVYPVEISKPGVYEFSMLGGEWSNCSSDSDNSYLKTDGSQSAIMVAFSDKIGPEGIRWEGWADGVDEATLAISEIGIPTEGQGKLFLFPKTANDQATLQKCTTMLDAPEAGTYYVQLLGSHALDVISDLQLVWKADLSAVEEIGMDSQVVSTTYYGIDGTQILTPASGTFVIEKSVMSDGHIKTAKKVIR